MYEMDVFFFGAGKIGKRWAQFCKKWDIKIKGFIDNNPAAWGKSCEGIEIFSADVLKHNISSRVCITCGRTEEVEEQLRDSGVGRERIISRDDLCNVLAYELVRSGGYVNDALDGMTAGQERKLLLDLNNGMVLGGVESWLYSMARLLKGKGYKGIYITGDLFQSTVPDDTFPNHKLALYKEQDPKRRIDMCIAEIMGNLPCTVICNFPEALFTASCIVKHCYPDMIRIIAVQHNDDTPYYAVYGLWEEYVDQFLTISSRMSKKLAEYGISPERIKPLQWKVSCGRDLNRSYSPWPEAVQIGYAGRITTAQKRADLLPVIAEALDKRGINFRLNVAGCGDYAEELDRQIKAGKLQKRMRLLGYIEREEIPDFWSKQDIMLSCSEWEGHSITQSEAMAAGAAPVVTDVSGAEDDVADGCSGYIVDIGDVDAIADRISNLYKNRDLLKQMGKEAHDTIYKRQQNMDQVKFWDELLEKVWQP